jgi:DNA modification methylase
LGYGAVGIELLPVAIASIQTRLAAYNSNIEELNRKIDELKAINLSNNNISNEYYFSHLTITKHAFSKENEKALANYQRFVDNIKDDNIRRIFHFAGLAVLEGISYTRKDGQYLRWDYRANRSLKSKFNKGYIYNFEEKIYDKLAVIKEDIQSNVGKINQDQVRLLSGSSLKRMASLEPNSIDLVITSPPYCNRYDYTRTYALELAYLGLNEKDMKRLRQSLLSATVENKSKSNYLKNYYSDVGNVQLLKTAYQAFQNQNALHEKLNQLNDDIQSLNNKNVPGMIYNYFLEMAVIIFEMARVLRKDGKIFMVNDNVQYNGVEIPIDLILSDFAESAGLKVDGILTLPRGKGNSSQQMKGLGRKELRKCVYIWSK